MTFYWMARRLGSVAGPVIQATGRSEFEDGLGSGYSYHMSVRTRLPDITKQTKFSREKADQLLARRAGVVSHREAMIQTCGYTPRGCL
jgi:hypothetical protein